MRPALRALSTVVLSAGLLLTAAWPLQAAARDTRPPTHPPGTAIAR